MCLTRVQKKKLLGHHSKAAKLFSKNNTGSATGRLLLKPGPGPWTRILKNLDLEKPGQ